MFQGGANLNLDAKGRMSVPARHREALLEAATSSEPKFFLGTDSAPHAQHTKETACGCAGCYTAHAAGTNVSSSPRSRPEQRQSVPGALPGAASPPAPGIAGAIGGAHDTPGTAPPSTTSAASGRPT